MIICCNIDSSLQVLNLNVYWASWHDLIHGIGFSVTNVNILPGKIEKKNKVKVKVFQIQMNDITG